MAIQNTTSGNVQQWLNTWLSGIGAAQSPAAADDGQQTSAAISSVTVSLSDKAEKLSRIHQEFFAGGPIASDKIHDLSLRLYEAGLLSAADVSRLTGEAVPGEGTVSQSISFLSDFIADEAIDGDSDGAKELNKALQVLVQADQPLTQERQAQEKTSAAYVTQYRDLLVETDADKQLIAGFDQLVDVFTALAKVREAEGANVQPSYSGLYENRNKR